jgi:NADPH:quinone reductase-like Zn-dependent oxidoreductase
MSDGFFAEYAIVDARLCAKLSDKMTFQQVYTPTIQ